MENPLILYDEYKNDYFNFINNGLQFLNNKKIILVGLCRSVENIIESNIDSIYSIFNNHCKKFDIALFENDSNDNTKEELEKLKKKYNNFEFISHDLNRPHYGPVIDQNRTTALAEYRNILKNYVANSFSDYDFTIVFDTDFQFIEANGIYNSFGWLSQYSNIDAICGNSFEIKQNTSNPDETIIWNYDSWAYRGTWWHDWHFKPPSINRYNPMYWFGVWILPAGSPAIKVNSAFGGMAIYKTKHYLSGQYSGEDCEHVTFHYSIAKKINNFTMCLNPSQMMILR